MSANSEYDILAKRPKPPKLSKGDVLFLEEEKGPKNCFVCAELFKRQKRCELHGQNIVIDRLPGYTPVCGYMIPGTPMEVPDTKVRWHNVLNPNDTGLTWVEGAGAECRTCDYYSGDKGRGFCAVLQEDVGGGDCCAAWHNDDKMMGWEEAQEKLHGKEHREQADGEVE